MLLYKKTANAKSYSHWPVTITSETVNLDQSECRKFAVTWKFILLIAHILVVETTRWRPKVFRSHKILF